MKRIPGFMSYTHDASLRRHHYGPIEPLERSPTSRIWALVRGIGLVGAIFYIILQGEWAQ